MSDANNHHATTITTGARKLCRRQLQWDDCRRKKNKNGASSTAGASRESNQRCSRGTRTSHKTKTPSPNPNRPGGGGVGEGVRGGGEASRRGCQLTFGIEGESQGYERGDNEDDESDILHGLPDEGAEVLRGFGGNHVGAEGLPPFLEVGARET